MNRYLNVTKINKIKTRIEVFFETDDFSKRFFINKNYPFYAQYNTNIEEVPDSIALIPFLSNVLPIIWLNNMELYVEQIDQDFYNCLSAVKNDMPKSKATAY